MKSIERKARDLWSQCVKIRDKFCIICGYSPENPLTLSAHHVHFLSQGNWQILFDIDFGVALCPDCHLTRPAAPHVDNKAFIDKLLPRLSHERQAKLCEFLMNPVEICTERPDWHKIASGLAIKLKELREFYEIDRYSTDEVYRGRT